MNMMSFRLLSRSLTSNLLSARKFSTIGLPLSPFHLAFPVHNLDEARSFYRDLLGCIEGRSSRTWIDYNMGGAQIVCHWAGNDYRAKDYFNGVDKDMVPVPHHGLCLTVDEFHKLAARVKAAKMPFVVEPGLRFAGAPGEQWTMFFKDPSGNNLEFKALTKPENLCTFLGEAPVLAGRKQRFGLLVP